MRIFRSRWQVILPLCLLAAATVSEDAAARGGRSNDPYRIKAPARPTKGDVAPPVAGQLLKASMPTQSLSKDKPVMMEAEELHYDRENSIVTARGKVEVVQGDFLLLADEISYNQKTEMVMARGHVSVMEPSGNVYFAEEAELSSGLKTGVIRNFRARLADNSLFAAREARRLSDTVVQLVRAVYSPCKVCDEQGNPKTPLWQIKAKEVLQDEDAQRITYHNAFLELYGVPVMYTPYLSHPTPGADNKTGFLVPEYMHSGTLGDLVKVPYYYSIAPDKDITVTPYLITKEAPVLLTNYRQKFDSGYLNFDASGTYPHERDALGNELPGRDLRGHVRSQGDFKLSQYWGWGFDVNRTTDDTYLRRYGFGDEDTLTSRLFVEGIRDRSYFSAQGLSFQGLTIFDDPDRAPFISPLMDLVYQSAPGWMGSRFSFAANALVLSRKEGADSRRLSMTGAWDVPFITSGGHVFETQLSVRADGYDVNDVTKLDLTTFDGTQTRLVPQAGVRWRYPLVKYFGSQSLTLEPTAIAVVSPKGGNPDTIPNEDSLVPEFSDLNLFSFNRYPGLDRVEEGPRVAYGIRGQATFSDSKNINFLFGQNYNFYDNRYYPYSNRVGDHLSDYVGRVGFTVSPFDVSYRFRIDRDNLSPRRSEVQAAFNKYPITLNLGYIDLDGDSFVNTKRELVGGASLALNENWTVTTAARRDLTDEGGMVFAGGGLLYQNECINILTGVNRTYIRDRDVEPNTSYTVRVGLKNLE